MHSDPEVQAMLERAEREFAQNRRQSSRRRGRIPARVIPLLDGGLESTDAAKAVREFMAGRETILVLSGGVGCGKTVAACEAVEAAGILGSGLFVKSLDLVRAGTFAEEFWEGLRNSRLLVIDDLGTEPLDEKGWALSNLLSLLDARYDDLAKTILTTNLNLDAFLGRYGTDGGRLRDRIRESGSFIELAGESMRRPTPKHWSETEREG